MTYREPDPRRAADERSARAKEEADVDRARDAMKRGAVWTPTHRRVARMTLLVCLTTLVGALAFGGLEYGRSRLRTYMLPCHGAFARCIDEHHGELCRDKPANIPMRCKTPCNPETGCEPVDDPALGEACLMACDPEGNPRAREEFTRCTSDRRATMSCIGCVSAWEIEKTCAADERCEIVQAAGPPA